MTHLGRRWKLTENVISKICEAREIGATYEISALYAGISPASLSGWLKAARELQEQAQNAENEPVFDENQQLLLGLLKRIEKADAKEAINLLQVIDKAAQSDPNWAWKILQQRYPADFIPAIKQDINLDGKVIIEIEREESCSAPEDAAPETARD